MSKKTGFSLPTYVVRDSESRKRQSVANLRDPNEGLNRHQNDSSSDNISLDSSIDESHQFNENNTAESLKNPIPMPKRKFEEVRGRQSVLGHELENLDQEALGNITKTRIPSNETGAMTSPYTVNSERDMMHYNALKELRLFEKSDNVGTVTRDHLANERTFLAYARTCLNLLICAITINQLYKSEQLQLILDQIEVISSNQILRNTSDEDVSRTKKITNNNLRISIKSIEIVFAVLGLFHCIIGMWSYFINLNIMIKDKKFSVSRLAMLFVIVCILAIDILFLYQGIRGAINS